MIVDLASHAINLLIDLCGKLLVSCRSHLLGLVRQYRQRCLQTMCEIAGLGDGTRNAPLTILEERIQVVDQRLHFRWIATGNARVRAFMNGHEPIAEFINRRYASPERQKSQEHKDRSD
jgi:hypothetical protein